MFSVAAGSSSVNIAPITFPATGSTTFNVTSTPALAGATTCNFGGSTSCTLPVTTCSPDALYRFDEGNWSGAANEVRDSSGNARHAGLYKRNSLGGVVASYPTQDPNGQKCRAAYFAPQATTGVSSTVKTPIVPGDQGTVHFWYKSNQAWSGTGAKIATLFDGTTSTAGNAVMPFYMGKSAGGGLYFYVEDSGSTLKGISGWQPGFAGFSYPAGVWHHIAATWDLRAGLNALTIYVDGVQTTSTPIASGSAGIFTPWKAGDTLHIGDARAPDIDVTSVGLPGVTVDSANGGIDEFYYYPYAINRAQIIADKDSAAPTCTSGLHHIHIEHASGSGLTCTPSTVTLKACADANCSTLYTGGDVAGTLTASGGTGNWVGGTAFSIDVSGKVTREVQVTSTAATLGATVTTPVGTSNSTTCKFGTATDCVFSSADAGFVFDVPNHVADLSQSVNISAVKKSDSSLACAPALVGDKMVNFNCSYTNPATGIQKLNVGGVGGIDITCGEAKGHSLNFDTTGKAATTVKYTDVGQMNMTANYTGASGTPEAGLVMNGSDTFIAAPKDFAVVTSLRGSASNYVAGARFDAKVTARNNSGATTPNFGKESPAAEGAKLSFSRCQPTGVNTVDGSFSGTVGAFVSGVASGSDLIWSEVGNIDVVATLTSGDYLSSGVVAATGNTGTSGTVCNTAGNVGPFRPAYFDTVVTPGCSAAFTYAGLTGKLAGQPFTVKVKAKRFGGDANNTTNTENYAGDWARAVTLSDAAVATNAAAADIGTLTNTGILAADFSKGVATTSAPIYTFAATRAPYLLAIRAVDTDTVSSSGHAERTTAMRSGRVRLSNAYGSVSPIYMPVEAQYWSGQSWIKNTDDSCTSTTGGSPQVIFAAAPASSAGWTLTPAAFGGGQMNAVAPTEPTGLRLDKAPPGATTITATTVPEWLKWTWGGVTTAVAPSANANVGIYGTKESRKAVHVRELY